MTSTTGDSIVSKKRLNDVFRGERLVRSIIVNGSNNALRKLTALRLVDAWVNSQVTTKDLEKEILKNRYTCTSSIDVLRRLYDRFSLEFKNGATPKQTHCIVIETTDDFTQNHDYGYGCIEFLRNSAPRFNLLVIVVPHATIYNNTCPWWFRSFELLYALQSDTASVMQYIKSASPSSSVNVPNYDEIEAGLDAFYAKKRETMKCVVISSISGGPYTVLQTSLYTAPEPKPLLSASSTSSWSAHSSPSSSADASPLLAPAPAIANVTATPSRFENIGKLPKLQHVFRGGERVVHSIVVNGSDYLQRKFAACSLTEAWIQSQVTENESDIDVAMNRITRIGSVSQLKTFYEQCIAPKKTHCVVIQTSPNFVEDREIGYAYIENLRNFAAKLNLLVIVVPHEVVLNLNHPWWFQKFDLTYILQSDTHFVHDYLQTVSGQKYPCTNSLPSILHLDAYFAKNREPSKCIVISSVPDRCPVVMRTNTSKTD